MENLLKSLMKLQTAVSVVTKQKEVIIHQISTLKFLRFQSKGSLHLAKKVVKILKNCLKQKS